MEAVRAGIVPIKRNYFIALICVCVCVSVCACTCVRALAHRNVLVHTWQSEDNFWKCVLSFHHVLELRSSGLVASSINHRVSSQALS